MLARLLMTKVCGPFPEFHISCVNNTFREWSLACLHVSCKISSRRHHFKGTQRRAFMPKSMLHKQVLVVSGAHANALTPAFQRWAQQCMQHHMPLTHHPASAGTLFRMLLLSLQITVLSQVSSDPDLFAALTQHLQVFITLLTDLHIYPPVQCICLVTAKFACQSFL